MTRPRTTAPISNGRKPLRRIQSFLGRERSISVLMTGIVVLAVGAVVLRVCFFHKWLLWFSSVTALTAFLLLFIATWDLVADLTGRLWHLVTDQQAPWGPWTHRLLVPVLLLAGVIFDHFVAH